MLTPYFAYRVLDPVSGAVVIPALPHPHRSKWTVRGVQPGATGSSTLGEFEIPLFTPLQDEYRQAADLYAKLDYNQRVEAFLIPSPSSDIPPGGLPKFSGVIRQLPLKLADYSIKGWDSMQLLTQARTQRTEFFTGTTDQLAAFALRAQVLVYGDDLTSGVGSYVQTGGAWTAATDEGLSATTISGAAPGTAWFTTPTSYAAAQFSECVIDGYFRVAAATNVGDATRIGVVAGGSGGQVTFGGINIRCTGGARWECDLEIASASLGGPITNRARKSLALPLPTNILRCQIQLIGRAGSYNAGTGVFTPNPAGSDFIWRVTVNGVDGNCVWIQTGASNSGPVGFYYDTSSNPGGAPQLWGTQLVHRNRNAIFQQGVFNVGSRTVQQYYSRTPNLDLLGVAAVTEGFIYRKTAGLGLNNDTVDFGPPVGAQLPGQTPVGSDSIARFEYGRNLKDASQEPAADNVASDISLQLSPGSTQSGQVEWHNVAAMRKYGVITSAVSAQNIADFLAARALAQSLSQLAGSPGSSKKLTVINDDTTAGLWREMDYVVVSAPQINFQDRRVQVIEYVMTEGSPEIDITGDAWPLDQPQSQLSRLWQTLDAIASGTMNITPSSSSGLIYDSRFASPTVLTAYGNDSLDSNFNFRLRFNIPVNTALIQKVTLSFSLLNYRTFSSFTLTSTGAAGSHSHTSATHNHETFATGGVVAGGAGAITSGDGQVIGIGSANPAANLFSFNATPGSTGGTSDHTHTVSGSSTVSIFESTIAQGVHIFIDGVDVTALLTPSGPYGSGGAPPQDFSDIDITPYVIGGGWHDVQMTSTTNGRVQAQVTSFVLVKPF